MGLWVLAKNQNARAFYLHQCGQFTGQHTISLSDDDNQTEEAAYIWPDIQVLLEAARSTC
jgi:hypothetical protein